MINDAFLIVAAIALGAALAKAVSMLRPRRPPGQGLLLILLLTLSVSCFSLSGTVQRQEDRLYHDLGRLLSNVSTMVAAFAILALLITLSMPLADVRPRVRLHLLALTGCITGMAVAFAVASPLPETLGDFGGLYASRPELLAYIVLFLAFLGTALAELLVLALRYARVARGHGWLRGGLLLMCVGSVLGLAYVAEKAVYVFTQAAHLPPLFASGHGCTSLLTPPQCVFSITLPVTAVFLAAIGATLPVWGTALAAPFRYHRSWRTFQALQPLWEAIHEAFPQVALHEPGNGPRWGLEFRLYRRVIEIDDGRLLLRPYTDKSFAALAAKEAEALGLTGDDLRATIAAAEIAVGLRAHAAGAPAPATPLADRATPDSEDTLREAAWLAKVARAYVGPPVVLDLAMRQQETPAAERP